MVIELNIARRVVSELHDAIRQPINLMDENGRIIASTDASRIGTVHSAACQAIRENMECLVVRADGEYAGSRMSPSASMGRLSAWWASPAEITRNSAAMFT